MTVQELIDRVKGEMYLAYGGDAIRQVVIETNTFSFVVYHDDGDFHVVCKDAQALLDKLKGVDNTEIMPIFWDQVETDPC